MVLAFLLGGGHLGCWKRLVKGDASSARRTMRLVSQLATGRNVNTERSVDSPFPATG